MAAAAAAAARVKLALVQLAVGAQKAANLANARSRVLEAARAGAQMVMLPECFNSPYGTQYFGEYAEEAGGESTAALAAMAREAQVYLVGGSIPERAGGRLFNTCTVWGPDGALLARHRKVHLFDIDVPGGITFRESDVLQAGDALTEFGTPWGRFGVAICYDMRFPEMAMIAARRGCVGMLYPGAFNTTTGPLHWELLLRARAVDNQIFTAGCSPARDAAVTYPTWGHSTIVDPLARVVATTGDAPDIVYGDLDMQLVEDTRRSIPVSTQRRFDLYPDVASQ
ncbi:Omega-amidase nit3 [Coemansia javaensis]|uniref:Omega-amidase nit3 n=1 Tax=Coemansia javaensis TaxID=2761396 RepID=A0A9W8HFS9_9FUNG|nr:Omega-amidase nit3 [Coemansia javaensis]